MINMGACASETDHTGYAENNEPDIAYSNDIHKASKDASHSIRNAKIDNTLPLPANWQKQSYNEWLKQLRVTECPAKYDGNEVRFKNLIKISASTKILLLTCDLGAYQDAYYIFKIDTSAKNITPLSFNTPSDKDVTRLKKKTLIWGAIYPSDNGKELELLNLSAGTGMCGYLAHFPLNQLLSGTVITPSRIFADEDCYNGITVEQWPEIKFK